MGYTYGTFNLGSAFSRKAEKIGVLSAPPAGILCRTMPHMRIHGGNCASSDSPDKAALRPCRWRYCTEISLQLQTHPTNILDKHGLIEWNIAELNKRLMLAMPVECKECSLLPCCPGICSQKRLEKTPFECVLNVTTKENIILFNIKQDAIQKRITNRNE